MSETSSSQDPDGRSSIAPRHIRRHVRWQQRENTIHIRGKSHNSIRYMSMGRTTAKRILSNLDTSTPFIHRQDFFDCLAAVTATYTDEVCRKVPGPNREVSHVLWTACAPDRIEWLWNNMRLRCRISRAELALLPSGTASNESLRAEVNSRTQSINAIDLSYNPNCK